VEIDTSVTVIIPVWNGEMTIASAVRSILNQEYPTGSLQIIVVDNGSSDRTIEILSEFDSDILLLEQQKPGSYAARNMGLRHATGVFVAFTDADCIADRKWLAQAIPLLSSDPTIGVVAGHIEVVESNEGSHLAFLIEKETAFKQAEAAKRGTSVTANWVSRRKTIEEAGGFNDSMKSGGDWLLSSQLSLKGYRVVYCADAVVKHPSRSGISDLLQKRRRVAGGVWARRKVGLLRLIRAEVAGGLRRTTLIALSKSLSLKHRLQIVPIILLMSIVSVRELVRLSLGSQPRRS
jgi:glycosyltransferase involved in cell wall biosynthesis